MSSFADGITGGDNTEGEDLIVRQAAIDALGNMNGTVVAIEPTSGRVLAMVNQRLALSSGAQPCSTIKLSVALAALSEGVVSKETQISLGGRSRMNLTEALAHSNNAYFEALGRKLGFEKVAYYAHQFGLGELAGYDIPGEQLGTYPDEVIPEKLGGVGKMCSFGEGVSMTPLQLGAMVSFIANGGTLYYLQQPPSTLSNRQMQPRIKRQLDIAPLIPEISDGMAPGAVCQRPAGWVLTLTKKRFSARPEPVLMPVPASDGSLLMRIPAEDASWWWFSWVRAGVRRSVPRQPRLPGLCTEIFTITTSSLLKRWNAMRSGVAPAVQSLESS